MWSRAPAASGRAPASARWRPSLPRPCPASGWGTSRSAVMRPCPTVASRWCRPAPGWANRRPTRPPSSRWRWHRGAGWSSPRPPWRCRSSSSTKICRPWPACCRSRLPMPWPRGAGVTCAASSWTSSAAATRPMPICSAPKTASRRPPPTPGRSVAASTSSGARRSTKVTGTATATASTTRPTPACGGRWRPNAIPAPPATVRPTTAAATTRRGSGWPRPR